MDKEIKITVEEQSFRKDDLIIFPRNQRHIIVEVDGREITAYPFPEGNWFVSAFRFVWIKIRYGIKKLWRWIKTPA